ncbi:hypothetical protein NPIL_566761 [Nephila pilipes]|uniref:Uncharacterized protein n=1 Tax=Nephila pilipes TaxID=299642 RepID=A0A8X6TFZ4_NEPPI|nr:hypothetical protein NPIL_566761 [Nephila pilipes]
MDKVLDETCLRQTGKDCFLNSRCPAAIRARDKIAQRAGKSRISHHSKRDRDTNIISGALPLGCRSRILQIPPHKEPTSLEFYKREPLSIEILFDMWNIHPTDILRVKYDLLKPKESSLEIFTNGYRLNG